MNFKKRKLGEIASITTGLVAKRKQAELTEEIIKKYKMLTLKSFEQDGWLNIEELEDFKSNEVLDNKYLTQEEDIVIRLSHPNTAVYIDKEHVGLLIPSLFTVIRLETDVLMPEYLSIYLNSNKMKRYYAKRSIGSAIQIIKTSMLRDIPVKFPDIEQQRKIVELNKLILREKKLLLKLVEEKTKYHKAIINKML